MWFPTSLELCMYVCIWNWYGICVDDGSGSGSEDREAKVRMGQNSNYPLSYKKNQLLPTSFNLHTKYPIFKKRTILPFKINKNTFPSHLNKTAVPLPKHTPSSTAIEHPSSISLETEFWTSPLHFRTKFAENHHPIHRRPQAQQWVRNYRRGSDIMNRRAVGAGISLRTREKLKKSKKTTKSKKSKKTKKLKNTKKMKRDPKLKQAPSMTCRYEI